MKILLIHSMAVHGTASMKAMISVLKSKVLPIPSLWLTGLTNVPGHQKFSTPFEEMLLGSLEIAHSLGESVVLYVGYLGDKSQVEIILEAIDRYHSIIYQILVDPVSGDHNKLYVPDEIVSAWPQLLAKANWAFPNFTELKIHAGLELTQQVDEKMAIQRFIQQFPNLSFLVTSLERGDDLGILMKHEGLTKEYCHEKLTKSFGGTGDLFAAHFINEYLFKLKSPWDSLTYAASQTLSCMKDTLSAGEEFLNIR